MSALDHLKGILCLSACSWTIFGLYMALSIQRFIVKRYQEETDLSRTYFFSRHMPFARHLPNFFSSPLYSSHLLMFVWGWKFVKFVKEKRKNVKYYDDIIGPEEITRYFSRKEIRRVKISTIVYLIIIAHVIAYYIFGLIWPNVFD